MLLASGSCRCVLLAVVVCWLLLVVDGCFFCLTGVVCCAVFAIC